jgi:hypothetical protein
MQARRTGVLLAILSLVLATCDGSGADVDALDDATTADQVAPLDATADPGADAAPDLPADLPADVPPADLPPADVPPADLPADVPPADAPEDTSPELIDEHCPPPDPFPEQCEQVSSFECGFQATCEAGVVHAEWHVHHFCSPHDVLEDILPYACDVTCPHGCTEGTFVDWPASGTELVALFCHQCALPDDCDVQDLPHDDCDGAWTCAGGQCAWECTVPCVAEGGSVAVIPNAPACCAGLGKVPCDAPDAEGQCQSCDGASVCVACGDGQCGLGENPCNCPADCTNLPVDLCGLAGGQCVDVCNEGGLAEYVVDDAGCKEGAVCCVPQENACLGLGGGFLDFDTAGKCCAGLTPSNDCDPLPDGSCSCPKCPCYLCLPCGDGQCGPFENACNCPADCAPAATLLPGTQSECQGAFPAQAGMPAAAPQPVGDDGAGIATLTVEGSTLTLFHEGLKQNCCAVVQVWATVDAATHAIRLEEKPAEPYTPCWCECFFTVTAELAGLASGTWTVTLYNQELGYDLMVQDVTVP